MTRQPENRWRVVNASRSIAVVLAVVWVLFAMTGISYLAMAQPRSTRPVFINNTFIGNVELFNLESGNVLNVVFHPVNNDMNIVFDNALNWVQIANRGTSSYPRVDPPNNLGGYPNKDNPDYWDNWAGSELNNIRYANNNYWMQDAPTPGNGIEFETWLTTGSGNNIQRLVCFNWGVSSGGTPSPEPNFINESKYNWPNALEKSNLQSYWTIVTSGGGGTGIPTVSEWGLILLTVLLIVMGTMFMKRAKVAV